MSIVVTSVVMAFYLSSIIFSRHLDSWLTTWIYALVFEFIVLEGLGLFFSVIVTMIVGSGPDACGCCRNLWITTILQAIKDTIF